MVVAERWSEEGRADREMGVRGEGGGATESFDRRAVRRGLGRRTPKGPVRLGRNGASRFN